MGRGAMTGVGIPTGVTAGASRLHAIPAMQSAIAPARTRLVCLLFFPAKRTGSLILRATFGHRRARRQSYFDRVQMRA